MKVRSYGRLADLLGSEREVAVGACTVAELRAHLAAQCPDAARDLQDRRVRACVGDTLVPDRHLLDPAEPVDLLAPLSGG